MELEDVLRDLLYLTLPTKPDPVDEESLAAHLEAEQPLPWGFYLPLALFGVCGSVTLILFLFLVKLEELPDMDREHSLQKNALQATATTASQWEEGVQLRLEAPPPPPPPPTPGSPSHTQVSIYRGEVMAPVSTPAGSPTQGESTITFRHYSDVTNHEAGDPKFWCHWSCPPQQTPGQKQQQQQHQHQQQQQQQEVHQQQEKQHQKQHEVHQEKEKDAGVSDKQQNQQHQSGKKGESLQHDQQQPPEKTSLPASFLATVQIKRGCLNPPPAGAWEDGEEEKRGDAGSKPTGDWARGGEEKRENAGSKPGGSDRPESGVTGQNVEVKLDRGEVLSQGSKENRPSTDQQGKTQDDAADGKKKRKRRRRTEGRSRLTSTGKPRASAKFSEEPVDNAAESAVTIDTFREVTCLDAATGSLRAERDTDTSSSSSSSSGGSSDSARRYQSKPGLGEQTSRTVWPASKPDRHGSRGEENPAGIVQTDKKTRTLSTIKRKSEDLLHNASKVINIVHGVETSDGSGQELKQTPKTAASGKERKLRAEKDSASGVRKIKALADVLSNGAGSSNKTRKNPSLFPREKDNASGGLTGCLKHKKENNVQQRLLIESARAVPKRHTGRCSTDEVSNGSYFRREVQKSLHRDKTVTGRHTTGISSHLNATDSHHSLGQSSQDSSPSSCVVPQETPLGKSRLSKAARSRLLVVTDKPYEETKRNAPPRGRASGFRRGLPRDHNNAWMRGSEAPLSLNNSKSGESNHPLGLITFLDRKLTNIDSRPSQHFAAFSVNQQNAGKQHANANFQSGPFSIPSGNIDFTLGVSDKQLQEQLWQNTGKQNYSQMKHNTHNIIGKARREPPRLRGLSNNHLSSDDEQCLVLSNSFSNLMPEGAVLVKLMSKRLKDIRKVYDYEGLSAQTFSQSGAVRHDHSRHRYRPYAHVWQGSVEGRCKPNTRGEKHPAALGTMGTFDIFPAGTLFDKTFGYSKNRRQGLDDVSHPSPTRDLLMVPPCTINRPLQNFTPAYQPCSYDKRHERMGGINHGSTYFGMAVNERVSMGLIDQCSPVFEYPVRCKAIQPKHGHIYLTASQTNVGTTNRATKRDAKFPSIARCNASKVSATQHRTFTDWQGGASTNVPKSLAGITCHDYAMAASHADSDTSKSRLLPMRPDMKSADLRQRRQSNKRNREQEVLKLVPKVNEDAITPEVNSTSVSLRMSASGARRATNAYGWTGLSNSESDGLFQVSDSADSGVKSRHRTTRNHYTGLPSGRYFHGNKKNYRKSKSAKKKKKGRATPNFGSNIIISTHSSDKRGEYFHAIEECENEQAENRLAYTETSLKVSNVSSNKSPLLSFGEASQVSMASASNGFGSASGEKSQKEKHVHKQISKRCPQTCTDKGEKGLMSYMRRRNDGGWGGRSSFIATSNNLERKNDIRNLYTWSTAQNIQESRPDKTPSPGYISRIVQAHAHKLYAHRTIAQKIAADSQEMYKPIGSPHGMPKKTLRDKESYFKHDPFPGINRLQNQEESYSQCLPYRENLIKNFELGNRLPTPQGKSHADKENSSAKLGLRRKKLSSPPRTTSDKVSSVPGSADRLPLPGESRPERGSVYSTSSPGPAGNSRSGGSRRENGRVPDVGNTTTVSLHHTWHGSPSNTLSSGSPWTYSPQGSLSPQSLHFSRRPYNASNSQRSPQSRIVSGAGKSTGSLQSLHPVSSIDPPGLPPPAASPRCTSTPRSSGIGNYQSPLLSPEKMYSRVGSTEALPSFGDQLSRKIVRSPGKMYSQIKYREASPSSGDQPCRTTMRPPGKIYPCVDSREALPSSGDQPYRTTVRPPGKMYSRKASREALPSSGDQPSRKTVRPVGTTHSRVDSPEALPSSRDQPSRTSARLPGGLRSVSKQQPRGAELIHVTRKTNQLPSPVSMLSLGTFISSDTCPSSRKRFSPGTYPSPQGQSCQTRQSSPKFNCQTSPRLSLSASPKILSSHQTRENSKRLAMKRKRNDDGKTPYSRRQGSYKAKCGNDNVHPATIYKPETQHDFEKAPAVGKPDNKVCGDSVRTQTSRKIADWQKLKMDISGSKGRRLATQVKTRISDSAALAVQNGSEPKQAFGITQMPLRSVEFRDKGNNQNVQRAAKCGFFKKGDKERRVEHTELDREIQTKFDHSKKVRQHSLTTCLRQTRAESNVDRTAKRPLGYHTSQRANRKNAQTIEGREGSENHVKPVKLQHTPTVQQQRSPLRLFNKNLPLQQTPTRQAVKTSTQLEVCKQKQREYSYRNTQSKDQINSKTRQTLGIKEQVLRGSGGSLGGLFPISPSKGRSWLACSPSDSLMTSHRDVTYNKSPSNHEGSSTHASHSPGVCSGGDDPFDAFVGQNQLTLPSAKINNSHAIAETPITISHSADTVRSDSHHVRDSDKSSASAEVEKPAQGSQICCDYPTNTLGQVSPQSPSKVGNKRSRAGPTTFKGGVTSVSLNKDKTETRIPRPQKKTKTIFPFKESDKNTVLDHPQNKQQQNCGQISSKLHISQTRGGASQPSAGTHKQHERSSLKARQRHLGPSVCLESSAAGRALSTNNSAAVFSRSGIARRWRRLRLSERMLVLRLSRGHTRREPDYFREGSSQRRGSGASAQGRAQCSLDLFREGLSQSQGCGASSSRVTEGWLSGLSGEGDGRLSLPGSSNSRATNTDHPMGDVGTCCLTQNDDQNMSEASTSFDWYKPAARTQRRRRLSSQRIHIKQLRHSGSGSLRNTSPRHRARAIAHVPEVMSPSPSLMISSVPLPDDTRHSPHLRHMTHARADAVMPPSSCTKSSGFFSGDTDRSECLRNSRCLQPRLSVGGNTLSEITPNKASGNAPCSNFPEQHSTDESSLQILDEGLTPVKAFSCSDLSTLELQQFKATFTTEKRPFFLSRLG